MGNTYNVLSMIHQILCLYVCVYVSTRLQHVCQDVQSFSLVSKLWMLSLLVVLRSILGRVPTSNWVLSACVVYVSKCTGFSYQPSMLESTVITIVREVKSYHNGLVYNDDYSNYQAGAVVMPERNSPQRYLPRSL